jgi:hypothetical protein
MEKSITSYHRATHAQTHAWRKQHYEPYPKTLTLERSTSQHEGCRFLERTRTRSLQPRVLGSFLPIEIRIGNQVYYHWHWYCNIMSTPGAYNEAQIDTKAFCFLTYSAQRKTAPYAIRRSARKAYAVHCLRIDPFIPNALHTLQKLCTETRKHLGNNDGDGRSKARALTYAICI